MVDKCEGEKIKIELEIPVKHPSKNIKQAVKSASLKFRREVWSRDTNLETIKIEMVLTTSESL